MRLAPRGRGPLVAAAVALAALAAIAWLLRGSAAVPPSPTSPASEAPANASSLPAAPRAAPPRDGSAAGGSASGGAAAAPRPPLPDEGPGPDAAAWRASKVAFGLRELGAMAPYVKSALDAARRDMEFCFREAPPRAGGAEGARPESAILLLYLEAREGALDVVDARVDYLGTLAPEVVECCREALRGLEIPAFRAVPGERYRLKYALE